MKKIILSILLFSSSLAFCQFNTILPSSESQHISPAIEKTAPLDTIAIGYFPSYSEMQKMERYRQRQYISLPLDTCIVTSSFGERVAPKKRASTNHRGIDLRCNGEYVYSILPGEIVRRGYAQSIGNYIEVDHGDFRSVYGHLKRFLVNLHEAVEAGQPIAISGNTGNSTGPHLHFGMKYDQQYIDPKPILDYIQSFVTTVKNDIAHDIEDALHEVKK